MDEKTRLDNNESKSTTTDTSFGTLQESPQIREQGTWIETTRCDWAARESGLNGEKISVFRSLNIPTPYNGKEQIPKNIPRSESPNQRKLVLATMVSNLWNSITRRISRASSYLLRKGRRVYKLNK
jgi:hypothetical protein